MDRETKDRISDFFDPWNLIEYLGVSTADVIDAFEEEIEDKLDGLEEVMEFKHG